MNTLPPALLQTAADRPRPAGRHIALVDGGANTNSAVTGSFVVVDATVTVDGLRRAIGRGAIGVALSGCRNGTDIQRLATLLAVAEAEEGRADGSTIILGLADGILPAPASPQGFAEKSARLAGLIWDAHALAQTLGISGGDAASLDCPPFAAARAAVLLAAAAAGVPAFDTAAGLEGKAFESDCTGSRDMGFSGRIAVGEAQVPVIDSIYGLDRSRV